MELNSENLREVVEKMKEHSIPTFICIKCHKTYYVLNAEYPYDCKTRVNGEDFCDCGGELVMGRIDA